MYSITPPHLLIYVNFNKQVPHPTTLSKPPTTKKQKGAATCGVAAPGPLYLTNTYYSATSK